MRKTLLTTTLLMAALTSVAQNDKSKKVESKYLNLPSYDVSATDPSTISIEFAMNDGAFGTEKLKEGKSICKPSGGTVKDAVEVTAYHYEIPYTSQESYVVAKSTDGSVVYAEKTSEIAQSVIRFGWDEKMKQAKCEYALTSGKLKKDFAKSGESFKRNEDKNYQNSVYQDAISKAQNNVSLTYMPEEFEVYTAKGKSYNYDDLDGAMEKAMAAYKSISKEGFNKNDLDRLREAVEVWENDLAGADLEDKKARVSKEVAKGLHENCVHAYLYLYDFLSAQKHAEDFLVLFGNFGNNRTEAMKSLLVKIQLQKMAGDKNSAIIGDVAKLHQMAEASDGNARAEKLGSDQFERLQSEFYQYKGSQAGELMEEKKLEEEAKIASGELNPYQKYYYDQMVGGPGINMALPPSALSGIPELKELPAEMYEFSEAKQIIILSNKIETIAPGISKLTELTKLDLSKNQLKTLPAEIGKLENLETLKLNNNPIESLPAEIGNLKNLKTLMIKGTKLSDDQVAEIQNMLPDCKIKN